MRIIIKQKNNTLLPGETVHSASEQSIQPICEQYKYRMQLFNKCADVCQSVYCNGKYRETKEKEKNICNRCVPLLDSPYMDKYKLQTIKSHYRIVKANRQLIQLRLSSEADVALDDGSEERTSHFSKNAFPLSTHLFLHLFSSSVGGTKMQAKETWMQLRELGCTL